MPTKSKLEKKGQPREFLIAYDLVKELDKYFLTIEQAEKVISDLANKAFLVNRNLCIREGRPYFKATIGAPPFL